MRKCLFKATTLLQQHTDKCLNLTTFVPEHRPVHIMSQTSEVYAEHDQSAEKFCNCHSHLFWVNEAIDTHEQK